ncbi:MAG: hypothetical protein QE265_00830 [Rhodoferax sp.]|nr:hypothetical protein [Rhodoferax sp.]
MANHRSTIFIQPEAPAKPAWGSACNGCGVCCLAEPCPVGVLLSGRRTGACKALVWADALGVYRCGALTEPRQVLANRTPVWMHWALRPPARLLAWMAPRWISAGTGCDCSLEVWTQSGKIRIDTTELTEPPTDD